MSSPSKQDAPLIPVQMEVCQMNEEIPSAELISSSAAAEAEAEADELCCLSGDKPFFSVVLLNYQVNNPHLLRIPVSVISNLPRVAVPMVLTHGDRKWNMSYNGKAKRPRFEYSDWRKFVADNNLKCDDACIFEVMESSSTILRLRVLILRRTDQILSPALAAVIESRGKMLETTIEID